MIERIKQTAILLMMLFIQFQPVHAHALMLNAEQAGHVAGTLSHSHEQIDSNSDSDKHLSDCHPTHTLSPPQPFSPDMSPPQQTATVQFTSGLLSIHIALDPRPPRHS